MVVKWNMWKFVENLRDFSTSHRHELDAYVCTSVKKHIREKGEKKWEKKKRLKEIAASGT